MVPAVDASQPTRARALVAALAKRELIEVRRVEIVARDFAVHVEALERAPSARELEHWLENHPQVTELSASDDALDELLGEFLAPPKPPPATVRNTDLEREIWQSEQPARAVAVYADWLQERNDPFGEQLALGLGDPDRFARYVRDNAARIFGEHHRELAPLDIVWRNGLIDKLRDLQGIGFDYRRVDPVHWAALLQSRSCEFIREIHLRRQPSSELDIAIAHYVSPGLMSAILDDVHDVPRLARRPTYHLAIRSRSLDIHADAFHPELEILRLETQHLELHGAITWNVRHLDLPWVTPSVVSTLRDIDLPRLEKLTASGDHRHLLAAFPRFQE